uniref:G-protein coupled receptors family 1 profile domain-containing protein n=1 Tax=Otolemur garnettii TaxID=30611 RepID=H0XXG7_OTOGA
MASSSANLSSALHNGSSCLPHLLSPTANMVLAIFYTALLVFSALGNSLALRLAFQKGRKINSTDVYLVHLAMSDLLFTLVLPGRIVYYALDSNWPFSEGLCRLTALIFFTNTYGSLYLMACVSVDRYLAVVRDCRGPQLRSTGRARLVCAAVWTLVLLESVPLLWAPMTKAMAGRLTCMEYVSVQPILGLPLVVLAACALSFCGPVGTILLCYVKITLKLCRTAQQNPLVGERGHHHRAYLLTLAVLMATVVCFSPYHLIVIQFMAREALRPQSCAEQRAFEVSLRVTALLMNTNCVVDPVIYFFASTRYRKWLLGILRPRASSPSSSPGEGSTGTPGITQARGSV